MLGDDKLNRVVVPPFKITDVPFANPHVEHQRDYRSYKIQFQAPQNVGMFTWKVYMPVAMGTQIKTLITTLPNKAM